MKLHLTGGDHSKSFYRRSSVSDRNYHFKCSPRPHLSPLVGSARNVSSRCVAPGGLFGFQRMALCDGSGPKGGGYYLVCSLLSLICSLSDPWPSLCRSLFLFVLVHTYLSIYVVPFFFLSLSVQLQRASTPTSILILISSDAFSSGLGTHLFASSRPLLRSAKPRRGPILAGIIILVLRSRTELCSAPRRPPAYASSSAHVSVVNTMSVCQWCSWFDNKQLHTVCSVVPIVCRHEFVRRLILIFVRVPVLQLESFFLLLLLFFV